MAKGDIFNKGIDSISASGYFNMQADSSTEIIIHNVSHASDARLEFYDGTNYVIVDEQTGNSSWMGMSLHCTNTKYYRVLNLSGSSNNMCCDGVQSK